MEKQFGHMTTILPRANQSNSKHLLIGAQLGLRDFLLDLRWWICRDTGTNNQVVQDRREADIFPLFAPLSFPIFPFLLLNLLLSLF